MNSTLKNTQRNLILAALLHDVGKYYNFKTSSLHQENSAQLISGLIKNFESLSKIEGKFNIDLKKIENLIKNHHASIQDDNLLNILKFSDRITATEREVEESKTEERVKRVETPLESIYSTIVPSSEKSDENDKKYYFSGKRISTLITEIDSSENDSKLSSLLIREDKKYAGIENYYNEKNWEEMKSLFLNLFRNSKNFDVLLTNIDLILFDFLKLVPSDVEEKSVQIPLYDHLKLTAAISLILSKAGVSEISTTQGNFDFEKYLEEKEVTLIGVDIGNIQSFISKSYNYEEARRKATKRIRGRSYMISIITEIIALHIIKELGLTNLNILRSSAGNLLIVSDKLDERKMKSLEKEIEEFIFREFKGDLLVSIAFGHRKIKDLFNPEGFSDSLKEIGEEMENKKSKRFSSILEELVKVNKKKSGLKICDVCGNYIEEPKNSSENRCKLCAFLEDFGEEVVKKDFIVITRNIKIDMRPKYEFKFGRFSYYLSLIDKNEIEIFEKRIDKEITKEDEDNDVYFLFFINRFKDVLDMIKSGHQFSSIKLIPFLEYSYVPLEEDTKKILPIELEENSKDNIRRDLLNNVKVKIKGKDEVVDFNKLCIAFFDLDNAGKVFSGKEYKVLYPENETKLKIVSFKSKEITLSKWVTLSFFTHFFFNVIANKLAKKWNVYVIFSGGDDIKIFGSPYEVLNFYFDFTEEFLTYFNKRLTFSGGIMLTGKYIPIFNSIKSIEELEKSAKSFSIDNERVKGFVSLLNQRYVFPIYSSKYMKDLFEKLIDVVEIGNEGKLSKSSIYNIFRVASYHLQNEGIKEGKKIFVGYSRIEYILKRNWNDGEEWEEFLENYIKKNVISLNGKNFYGIQFFVPIFSFFYSTISEIKGGEKVESSTNAEAI
jgi:CRISPR-associated protein Csm1